MEAFLSWPGWAGVSGIAQLLALLAVVGALWRFFRSRGQVPMFYLDVSVQAEAKLTDGKRFHVVEFRNTGRSSTEVHILECFGGKVRLEEGYVAPKVMPAGGTFQLLVTAPKISEVWFRVTWRTPDVRRRVTVGWWPAAFGDVEKAWRKDVKRWTWYRRALRHVWGGEVAPGRNFRGWYHAWPWEDIHRVSPQPDESVIYGLGTFHNVRPRDIPFEESIR